jgi:hypothetical protein
MMTDLQFVAGRPKSGVQFMVKDARKYAGLRAGQRRE